MSVFGHIHHHNHQKYYYFHHRNHHFHYQNQFEFDSVIRAKMSFLAAEKGPPCPFRRGGGESELNGQCQLRIFVFLDFVSNHLIIWSSGHHFILSSCHLIIWSSGNLVNWSTWSSVHTVNMVIWSSGHLVIRSSGHLVIWSSGRFQYCERLYYSYGTLE